MILKTLLQNLIDSLEYVLWICFICWTRSKGYNNRLIDSTFNATLQTKLHPRRVSIPKSEKEKIFFLGMASFKSKSSKFIISNLFTNNNNSDHYTINQLLLSINYILGNLQINFCFSLKNFLFQ